MKTKAGVLILAVLVLVTFCTCGTSEYQSVTFEELTVNTTAYDGEKVSISGIYKGELCIVCSMEYCECNCSEWEIVEEYRPMRGCHYYGIEMNGIEIAFIPPDIDNDGYIDEPDLENDQEILLNGVAQSTSMGPPCPCPCSCEVHRSLVVQAHDIIPR